MPNEQTNEATDELPLWELMYKCFPEKDELVTLQNDQGETVASISRNRLREACSGLINARNAPLIASNFRHWWPDILSMVARGWLRMTVARGIGGEDRFVVDPRMIGYL